ncbi:MAG: alcohol dehydrogenase [Planctomycetaceae bacterium]|nr:alcohol dehydrogenase [Planctomycetaceae bacterium]
MTASQPKTVLPTSNDRNHIPAVYDRLAAVGEILDRLSCRSVFLVADPVAYEGSGAKRVLTPSLASRHVVVFREFRPNPCLESLKQGIESYQAAQADVILAVGGGTAIDLAKLIGYSAAQAADPADVIATLPSNPRKGLPLIVAPTTAGTGSEATHFAVVYKDGRKHSVAHPYLLPEHAIVDASLTETMPPNITAQSGLDALCQAIESMWSVHSTPASVDDATESIRLAWRHLNAAVHHPSKEDRRAMCRAAHLAGRAINISKTTAPHAISYTITSQFSVPHGRAVALTLGAVLAFNAGVSESECADPRGPAHVGKTINDIVRLLGFETARDAERGIQSFVASLDCPTRLSEVGVTTDSQIEEIAGSVNVERLANNPRRLTGTSLRAILKSIR